MKYILKLFNDLVLFSDLRLPYHCQTISVSMKNEPLSLEGSRQGTYQISNLVNGKPSWKSPSQGIWYIPLFERWVIGSSAEIGTAATQGIFSEAEVKISVRKFALPYDYEVSCEYYNGNWSNLEKEKWLVADKNDLIVNCTNITGSQTFRIHTYVIETNYDTRSTISMN